MTTDYTQQLRHLEDRVGEAIREAGRIKELAWCARRTARANETPQAKAEATRLERLWRAAKRHSRAVQAELKVLANGFEDPSYRDALAGFNAATAAITRCVQDAEQQRLL